MKRNIKGLIALVLAVAMILSCGIFASGSRLFASTEGAESGNTDVQQVAVETTEAVITSEDPVQLFSEVGDTAPQEILVEADAEGAVEVQEETESPELFAETQAPETELIEETAQETEVIEETKATEETEVVEETETIEETEAIRETESEIEEYPESEEYPETEETQETEESEEPEQFADMSVDIVAVSMPDNGVAYVMGETISFAAIVTNTGEAALTDISITDDLSGMTVTTEDLVSGESSGLLYLPEHVVDASDVERGYVEDAICGRASTGKGQMLVKNASATCKVGVAHPRMAMFAATTSTPQNGSAYVLGEKIVYSVFISNTGELPLTDIEIQDSLTGEIWSFNETLAVGDITETYNFEYTVTEKDIEQSIVTDTFKAKASYGAGQKDVLEATCEEKNPTMAGVPSVYITQTVTTKKAQYDLHDAVEFSIYVLNNGEGTLKDIIVADELSGETWTIDALEPMESKTFKVAYEVQESDILAGMVVNQVTVTGSAQDPDTAGTLEIADAASATAQTVKVNKTFQMTSGIVDKQSVYAIGDTVTIQIEVANKGNVTQDLSVANILQGITGTINVSEGAVSTDAGILVQQLAPGESRTIICTYTILRTDAGLVIGGMPTASNGDIEVVTNKETIIIAKPVLYTLTVNYIYADGTPAAASYVQGFAEGDQVGAIASPEIAGFAPEYNIISGFEMPAQDLVFTIVYHPVVVEVVSESDDQVKETEESEKTAAVEIDENGDYVLTEITDSQVPMGDKSIRDTYFCILHWVLVILVAAALVVFFVTRRRQVVKISEMKENIRKEMDEHRR